VRPREHPELSREAALLHGACERLGRLAERIAGARDEGDGPRPDLAEGVAEAGRVAVRRRAADGRLHDAEGGERLRPAEEDLEGDPSAEGAAVEGGHRG